MVEIKRNESEIIELEVTTFEFLIMRDHYLFLMLGICEDFDDDLLFDAIDLLAKTK
jgi:hypothetical protein